MLVSAGESLIDQFRRGPDQNGEVHVVNLPGGSPFNVAIAMAALGAQSGFLCPTSKDSLGETLRERLSATEVVNLCSNPVAAPTARAVVTTDESGHPSYQFFREKSADRSLDLAELLGALPENLEALHFGSLMLAQESDWLVWRVVVEAAKSRGAYIAFDPNLRPALIDDMNRYPARLTEALALSDLVKLSDEDLQTLYPDKSAESVLRDWRERFDFQALILTRGALGARGWTFSGLEVDVAPSMVGDVVDTVGAGDTFQGALMAWLHHKKAWRDELSAQRLLELLTFATRAAGLNCLRPGCAPPTLSEVGALVGDAYEE